MATKWPFESLRNLALIAEFSQQPLLSGNIAPAVGTYLKSVPPCAIVLLEDDIAANRANAGSEKLPRSGTTRVKVNIDERTWYVLLQIGFPEHTRNPYPRRLGLSHDSSAAKRHLTVVRNECRPLGIEIRSIDISIGRRQAGFEHYVFRFRDFRRDDSAAIRLTEAFAYGMALATGPLADANDPLVLRVPDALIHRKRTVPLDALVTLEESRPWGERTFPFPNARIASVSKTVTEAHELGWRIAAVTYQNAALFDATRFLQRSYENFYVSPGGISEVMYDDAPPSTGAGQNDREDALHSAFKAIEAVIGDPSKNDRRFFATLANIGIDPAEEVGYLNKIPIHKMIRRMNEARDKRSAHGSTRDRKISAAELLDFQTCADEIVTAALEMQRGCPLRPGAP